MNNQYLKNGAAPQITEGKVVDLRYRLKNSNGKVLDEADSISPFTYLHGAQQIVPGLEKALDGLTVGDKKDVVVKPGEGYGELDPNLRLMVNRSQFPNHLVLEAGMQFEAKSKEGEEIVFTINSVEGDQVHIDGNHPLAGETLHFEVEVLSVRNATAEELEHGHAHGPHGHEH